MSPASDPSPASLWLPFVGTLLGALIGGGSILLAQVLAGKRQGDREREGRREAQLFERQRRRVNALIELQDLATTSGRQLGDLGTKKLGGGVQSLAYKAAWVAVYQTRSSMLAKAVQVEDERMTKIVDSFDEALAKESPEEVSKMLRALDKRVGELLPELEDPAAWVRPKNSASG